MKKVKTDINDITDIKLLVDCFYEKIKVDNRLGNFFKNTKWNHHLPLMYKFFDNVLFQSGKYIGNPMGKHMEIVSKMPILPSDFQAWIKIFNSTVDEHFNGPNAKSFKKQIISIAAVMEKKISSQ